MNKLKTDYNELLKAIDYTFKDENLLLEALTHSSYANERRINGIPCNERLEFLGDAVLELVSSDYIFEKFTNLDEGKLSKIRSFLVCEPSLFKCAKTFDLNKYIMLGKGEEMGDGRNKPSVVSDAFEALIGAVYLDGGIEEAKKIIHRFILTKQQLDEADMEDSKSYLQKIVQSRKTVENIKYNVVSESGPEHNKSFEVEVIVGDKVLGRGCGQNKKAAEKEAARQAILKIKNN